MACNAAGSIAGGSNSRLYTTVPVRDPDESMAFPKRYAEIAARTRVPAGFLIAVVFLALVRPGWASLAAGGSAALPGMLLRAWAAGHLAKYERLATSGPFAHVRNPLYIGTLIVGIGFSIAGAHLAIGLVVMVFFVIFYLPVIEEEEQYLRGIFPDYAEYEARVPRFWPKLFAQYHSDERFRFELYKKNREHHALAGFLFVMALLAVKAELF